MEIRQAIGPNEAQKFDSESLRAHFLVQHLVQPNRLRTIYSHHDRMIIGAALPIVQKLELPTYPNLKADFFLQRREMGIINLGGNGVISADDQTFDLANLDCLYLGKGTERVTLRSNDIADPAVFFLLSTPAHQAHPTRHLTKEAAAPAQMGAASTANERTIYKYIHQLGIQSCQLVMGLTILAPGSVWNTMPAHVHDRRMEAYFYFDLAPEHRVFHFMGQPQQTRHLVVGNHEAVISPPWSIHSGCGTASYGFVWGMAGENRDFADMDLVPVPELK